LTATGFSSRDEIAIDGFPITGEPEVIASQKSPMWEVALNRFPAIQGG